MLKIIAFTLCSLVWSRQNPPNYAVNIEITQVKERLKINLAVNCVKITDKIDTVILSHIHDFKREKVKAFGNYIIEMQSFRADGYRLLEPSADIDQNPSDPDVIYMEKGESLIDSISIDERIFSRKSQRKEGLTAGKYRIRVHFNPDMWKPLEINISDWIEFQIQ